MKNLTIQELRELDKNRTQGEWYWSARTLRAETIGEGGGYHEDILYKDNEGVDAKKPDGDFIAAAPQAYALAFQLDEEKSIFVKKWNDEEEKNIKLEEENKALRGALEAHYAWSYAEHKNLGNFNIKSELCNYAEHLTEKALFENDKKYSGLPHLFLNPVALERASEDEVKALVKEVMELALSHKE